VTDKIGLDELSLLLPVGLHVDLRAK
jgi:hypothetical protein